MSVRTSSLLSFSRAPGFGPISKEAFLSTPLSKIAHNTVPAYVLPNVITEDQEALLKPYMGKLLDRLDFVENHVDSLIHHYKEFYRSTKVLSEDANNGFSEADELIEEGHPAFVDFAKRFPNGTGKEDNSPIGEHPAKAEMRIAIKNCRDLAQSFIPRVPLADRLHFLQLHTSGFIRAHVDESRNSSACVAGVTLGTARVMTLTHPKYQGAKIDMLLAPRSMYVIVGTARTQWEHSVDWEVDDKEHNERAKVELDQYAVREEETARSKKLMQEFDQSEVKSDLDLTQPVIFEGKESGYHRGTRNALIWRGVSPMELFRHKMMAKEQSGTD